MEPPEPPPSSIPSAPEEPAPRFDPYTGKPLVPEAPSAEPAPRFDPYTGEPIERATQSRRDRRPYIIGAAVVGVLVIGAAVWGLTRSGGNSPGSTDQGHALRIALDLHNPADPSIDKFSKGCDGSDTGYDDISAGAPVTVKDKAGTVLASTFLASGTNSGSDCLFDVSVNVPDSDFYQIEVSHRGSLTYSKSDLESNGWEADLSIGS